MEPLSSLATGDSVDLGHLWHELLAGRAFVAASGYASERCDVTILAAERPAVRPAAARMLERVLVGEPQKVVALELGLANSTVACACSEALAAITAERKISRSSMLIVAAAHSALGLARSFARVDEVKAPSEWRLSMPLTWSLYTPLSPSEREVTRLVVEGHSHANVARVRHTSPRTTANQLASVFRKLGISGTGALRSRLVRQQCTER